jgi:hypothetical protein
MVYAYTVVRGGIRGGLQGLEAGGGTDNASIDEGIFKIGVSCEELLVEEWGVLDVLKERSVDGVSGG